MVLRVESDFTDFCIWIQKCKCKFIVDHKDINKSGLKTAK